jgi:hypothetical protein
VSNDPHQGHGASDRELARLAQEGQARLQAAHRDQAVGANAAADRNIRTAIGPVRGAPVKLLLLVLFVLSVVALITVGFAATHSRKSAIQMVSMMPWAMPAFFGCIGLLCAYLFMPPMASRAGVEAERAWAASLPFALEHYFDVIGAAPEGFCSLRVTLWWTSRGVDERTLQGLIALFDTQSTVLEVDGRHASFLTGQIEGFTGIRINRAPVYRNHRLGKAVHRLVDLVLLPMHRSAPLARVTLSRS